MTIHRGAEKPCCARATSGHAAPTLPPSRVMNFRHLIRPPGGGRRIFNNYSRPHPRKRLFFWFQKFIEDALTAVASGRCEWRTGATFADLFVVVVSSDYSHPLRLPVSMARNMLLAGHATTVPANDSPSCFPASAVLSAQYFCLCSSRGENQHHNGNIELRHCISLFH
jgi:hypothetical protein